MIEHDDLSNRTAEERKAIAKERWETLPSVIKDIFANAPRLAMYEVLRKLGVDAQPARAVEWAYPAADGSLVVTIWHDNIEIEPDKSLRYVIPPAKWRGSGAQGGRADRLGELLGAVDGKTVKVMLLRHEWDKNGTQFAKTVAADLKRWRVERAGDDLFVLRR